MNKNVFPLSKKQQKMKANFVEHEYNYVKVEGGERGSGKIEAFQKAYNEQIR